ncbi:MAG: shikimate kinase [Candidatus Gastranaerophilaceae bacterium]|nr:shikimate kinase [Candidatus Gastranaerophilaceae bacterium]
MKNNLVLIGMMGCGKTTVAKQLEKLLPEYNRIDIDEEIEKSSGKKISEIFLKFGEPHFRLLESNKIKSVLLKKNQIIALGGGAFENAENRAVICSNAKVIYLKTSAEEIYKRIKNEFHRPLLSKNVSAERILEIMNKREPNYLKADIIVQTDNKTPEEISKEILEVIENA